MRLPSTVPYRWLIVGSVVALGVVWAVQVSRSRVPAVAGLPEVVDFNFHVKPILSDRCFACHGPDDGARKAGLRLDREDGAFGRGESGRRAVVPGRPGQSELVRRITSADPDERMPPAGSHLSLTDYEKAVLVRWVEQGAVWKPHWSFLPARLPALPQVARADWPRNEVDAFVLARLEERGWQPSPEAPRETWIRRVSFDLTGLPPTLEEVDAFLADTSSTAYERVVDRLLASPAYGERMATDWLDLARYADSHGYQDDGMRNMWPWRDWVIRAFNANVPYDRFVTWQLAGDLLPAATPDQLLATGFNRNHSQSQEGGIVPEEYRVEYVADRVNTLGRAFLGLTVECARCHDHKYDPVLQKEYFQLFSFFNSVNESGQIPYSGEPSPTLILKDSLAERRLAALHAEMAAYEAQVDPAAAAFDAGFAAWVRRLEGGAPARLQPPGLIGHYPLEELRDLKTKNLAGARAPAVLDGDRDRLPVAVPGHDGGALRLVGDSFLDLGREVAYVERNEPFSISLWLRIDTVGTEGPVFSRSGGLMNGNRGYDCMLRPDGTLTASLNHVWPDDAVEIETTEPVAPGAWRHLVMTYDGSSRAAGLRLFLDGRPMASRVVTDNLRRSLRHRGDGSNWGGMENLRIGRRFESTLSGVAFDEFRVFDRSLTALEVAALAGDEQALARIVATPEAQRTAAQRAALREHYVRRVDPGYARAFARLTALRGEENEVLTALPVVMVMRDRMQPRPTFVLRRGAYDAPGEPVEAGTPAAVLAFPDSLPPDRLGLSRWLLDPRHPLTARVAVNRFWQMFFGHGLVETTEDFGNQGALPTHPELLDWLAVTFVESGWDVQAMLRRIALSATYRQASAASPELREADPENDWLARGPSHRLPAEMIRDNALAASGLLVRQVGGPSVKPYQPPGLWEELATRNATVYEQDHGDALYRRGLYTIWKRSTPPPSMISFDAAERYFCTVRRQRTSTPLQALVLMNDPQYVEAARVLAERMVREGGPRVEDRITHGFRLLTSRRPDARELAALADLYAAEHADFAGDEAAALGLLSVGEHPRDGRLPPAETAALAVVASTILNFDEVVTKR